MSPAFIPALYFHSYFFFLQPLMWKDLALRCTQGEGEKKNPEKWIKKVNEK